MAYATTAARFAAGEYIADPAAWARLGASGDGLWGRYDGTAAEPYAVLVDPAGPRSRCACPSRLRPCKHVIALLVLWVRGHVPDVATPPAEIAEWLRRGRPQVAGVVPAGPGGDGGSAGPTRAAAVPTSAGSAAGTAGATGDAVPAGRPLGRRSGAGPGPGPGLPGASAGGAGGPAPVRLAARSMRVGRGRDGLGWRLRGWREDADGRSAARARGPRRPRSGASG